MRLDTTIRSAPQPAEEPRSSHGRAARDPGTAHFWVDTNGHVERWSPEAALLFGHHAHAVLGRPLDTVLADGPAMGMWSRIRSGLDRHGRWEDLGWRPRSDGARFWGRCVVDTCRSLEGEPVGWLVVTWSLDTEGRVDEPPLDPSALRLQSLGRAASGMAHDLSNILMAIECFAGLVEADLPDGARSKQVMSQLLDAARRGMRLSRGVLDIGGADAAGPVDLAQCVRQMEPLLRALMSPGVKLVCDVPTDGPAVTARARDIELMLLNLVVNARDALEEGGVVEVVVERSAVGGNELVTLSVRDTGTGIPDRVRDRVFESHVTTKGGGQGTGLGLAMVVEAVRASDARLELHSSPGAGTKVDVVFPTGGSAALEASPASVVGPEGARAAGRRVLLHESLSEGVRRPLGLLIGRRGYDVSVGTPESPGTVSADLVIVPANPGLLRRHSTEDLPEPGQVGAVRLVRPPSAGRPEEALVLRLPCAPDAFTGAVRRLLEGTRSAAGHGLH